jgi:HPt (histidine-containing phosphotransfer) domain-containing protein
LTATAKRSRIEEASASGASSGSLHGDVDFLKSIATAFLEGCPRLLAEIGAAASCGDWKTLERHARVLKGAIGNFGAPAAVAAASRLEASAQTGDLVATRQACEKLKEEIARLTPALDALRTGGDA